MKDNFIKAVKWLAGSFENKDTGASATKITLFVIVALQCSIHIAILKGLVPHDNLQICINILDTNWLVLGVLSGKVTVEQLTKFIYRLKNGGPDPETKGPQNS